MSASLRDRLRYRMQGKEFTGRYEPDPGQLVAFLERQEDISIDSGTHYSSHYPSVERPLSEAIEWLGEEPNSQDIAQYVLQTFEEQEVQNYHVDVFEKGGCTDTDFSVFLQYQLSNASKVYNKGEACITGTVEGDTDFDFERYVPTVSTGVYDVDVAAASTLIEHTEEIDADIPLYICDPTLGKTEKRMRPTNGSGSAFTGEEAANIFNWIAAEHGMADMELRVPANSREYTLEFDVQVPISEYSTVTESLTYQGTLPVVEESVDATLERFGCVERSEIKQNG